MEGHEPDSRYLVLWICVIITAGIILTGWGVSMKHSFNKINTEMDGNVGQSFEEAEQEVLNVFGDVNNVLKESSKGLQFTEDQQAALEVVEDKAEGTVKKLIEEKE